MAIVFNPPLDTATVLAIPPNYQDGAELDICFTATFESADELAKLEQDNVQVELWSNIPVSERPLGEWGALQFSKVDPLDTTSDATVTRGSYALRLGPCDSPSQDVQEQHILQLAFTTRVPTGVMQYKYTYRLVSPDGTTQWLGQYGRDGVLLIERADPRITPAPTLDWTYGAGQASLQLPHDTSEVEVAQLNMDLEWSSWVLSSNGRIAHLPSLPNLACSSDTSLLILLPSTEQNSLIENRPLLINASHPHSFSVLPTGSIHARSSSQSTTSIHLRTFEERSELRAFVEEVLDSAKTPLKVLSAHPGSGHVLLAPSSSEHTFEAALIPFTSSKEATKVDILPSALVQHLSLSSEARICVSDIDHSKPLFISSSDESLQVEAGHLEGRLLVTTPYRLPGNPSLSVAVLGPYKKIEAELVESSPVVQTPLNSLPSPPPTPDRISKGLHASASEQSQVRSGEDSSGSVVDETASVSPPHSERTTASSDDVPVTPLEGASAEKEKHVFPSSPKGSNSPKDDSLAEFMSFPPTPGALFAKAAACMHDRHSPRSFVGAVMGGILRASALFLGFLAARILKLLGIGRSVETAENDLPPSRRALGRRMSQVGLRASSPSLSPTMDRLTLSPLRSTFNLDEPSYFPEVTPVQEEKPESPVKTVVEDIIPTEASPTEPTKTEDHLLSPLKLTTPLKSNRPTLSFQLETGAHAVCIRPDTPTQASAMLQRLIVRLDDKNVIPDILDVHNDSYLFKIPGNTPTRLSLSLKED